MKRSADILLFGLILLSLFFCTLSSSGLLMRTSDHHPHSSVSPVEVPVREIREGDLIFREGKGVISEAMKRLSLKDSRYSHAGIIHFLNDEPYVIHAMGGEYNPLGKIRIEKLSAFCTPEICYGFGIYRTDFTSAEIQQFIRVAEDFRQKQLIFDTDFDLDSDDKLYCTELIYKTIQRIRPEENFVTLSRIAGKSYVACDDIYLSKNITFIHSTRYLNSAKP